MPLIGISPILSCVTPAPTPWEPSDLGADLLMWLEISADTITLADGYLAKITDRTGNGYNLIQNTAGNRPQFQSANMNGKDSALFRAAGSNYMVMEKAFTAATAPGAHIFAIVKLQSDPPGTSNTDGFWSFGGGVSARIPFTGDGVIYDNFAANTRYTTANPTPSMASLCAYEVISITNEWTNYVNGTYVYTSPTNTVAWKATQCFGADKTPSPTYFYNGQFCALFMVKRKLTTAERLQFQAYITRQYGITFAV